ncbi:uncharacterized protein LOC123264021 isoform X1 [Cotesia glomerata]|uniref:uncharacterized protein LOC123264021 isoform X1 n=1 Tax=Cotesia glomerata TaxID=32391 RepID=UPI001D022BAC|nr:uncharacterized protein LOC123264021 isoform X1 [Cotesia glomerata]
MNTSRHLSRVAKKLVEEKGILSTPETKLGTTITDQILLKIANFYNDDEYSALMPGMKDFVSVRNDDGNRVHVQKRLVLSNLKELYQCFREINPAEKVGFSKFASLRPKHYVLAGASGTHTICVCTIHQNFKLMMLGANVHSLTRNTEKSLKHYNDCLDMIICETPTEKCYLGGCNKCPGVDELSNILLTCFENQEIENVTYKRWVSKPRCSLETFIQPTEEFIENLCSELKVLLPHSFIAKEQAKFLKTLKETLKPNEYVIICDFAENYAFVVQNAASGFHWNNDQATVFPVVIYYKVNDKLEHRSLVIISDCNNHDAVAVHVFIKIITDYVKSLPERCNKIYYFSDGAPQQFKNFKNFVNLYYHEDDFDIPAEWHFFATAHGKGPCDGIGDILKRLAARASLQLAVDKQITTPIGLYEWTSDPDNLPNIIVKFSPEEDYNTALNDLNDRFTKTKPILGTQQLHCVIPDKNGCLYVKKFSNSNEHRICKILKRQREH